MGLLDRLFGRRRRGDAGNGTTASTAPLYTTPDTAQAGGRDDDDQNGNGDDGNGGNGDSGGGNGGGNGGGGNGGGGGE